MRLSTSMMYQQNMQGIINGQATWQKTGEQLSTGKRVVNPSDDPIAAASAIMLGQAQSENSQYTLARTFAKQSMSLEESILNKSSTTITSALTEVIKGGGVLNDDDRKSVATSLRGMKAELLNMANSTDGNGNYIFLVMKPIILLLLTVRREFSTSAEIRPFHSVLIPLEI